MDLLSLQQIAHLIDEEERLARCFLHLSANETVLSPFAQSVLSSPLHNRYLLEHIEMRENSPSRLGTFLYRGLDRVNIIEHSAVEICRRMFGAEYVEFRCLSGIHAMQTTIVSLTRPGDKIMHVSTKDGGHFLTQQVCKLFGRSVCDFVFDRSTYAIDLQLTREVFERERPTLLYIDAMNYLFPFPVSEIRQLVGNIPIVYDASHTLGLIAGAQFQDPLREGADILQGNTHKTFFGPQKALILGRNRELMEKISYNLSTGMVSSQHTASVLALFISLHEMYYYGKEYSTQVVENARFLANSMFHRGLSILAPTFGFTKNHMFFVDVRHLGSGPQLLAKLLDANISANRVIPFEHIDTIRFGVQEITRYGYSHEDLEQVADWISRLLLLGEDPLAVREDVIQLVRDRQPMLYYEDVRRELGPNTKEVSPTDHPIEQLDLRWKQQVEESQGQEGGAEGRRPRWVDFHLEPARFQFNEHLFQAVRSLAHLAGRFEHQTDSAGNISFQFDGRIFITTSGCHIRDLTPDDFTEIIGYEAGLLQCRGLGPPSSEAYMHYLVYRHTNCAATVHGHYLASDRQIQNLRAVVVPAMEGGSVALAEAVSLACNFSHVIYIQMHGFVFWGSTIEECQRFVDEFVLEMEMDNLGSAG